MHPVLNGKGLLTLIVTVSCSVAALADARPVAVGLLADLTGTGASNGQACREGYEVARKAFAPGDQAGNNAIRFLYGDHRGDAKTGLSEVARIIDQGAIVIASNRGNVGMAIGPETDRRGVPLLGIMGHADFTKKTPTGFRFWPSPEEEGARLASHATKTGKRRAALVVLEDDYILAVAKSFEAEFTRSGGAIVFRENVSDSDNDWSATLTRIRTLAPDVLFLNASVSNLGTLIRRARELGLRQNIVANFWLSYPEVLATAGARSMEGATFVSIDLRRPAFQRAHSEQFPASPPTAVTYACYSALAFLLGTWKSSVVDGPRQLFIKLSSVKAVQLLDEQLQIIDREAKFELIAFQYRDGRLVESSNKDPL